MHTSEADINKKYIELRVEYLRAEGRLYEQFLEEVTAATDTDDQYQEPAEKSVSGIGVEREQKQVGLVTAIVSYLVFGWIVIQVGEVTFEALGLPQWSLTLLIVVIFVGFPVSIFLTWNRNRKL
jgi:hypothetical protein